MGRNRRSKDQAKTKLINLLTKIFQFDSEDLDFGIYKILNYKKKEIRDFIDKDLVEEIAHQLNLMGEGEQDKLKEELEDIKKQLAELRIQNYENNPIYQEAKKRLEESVVPQEREMLLYNQIYAFFSRYYDNGDFFSKRRYGSNERYMISYGGEEVMLHWANNDQYYIKTTESFNKFSFNVSGINVNFRVVEAEEEKGNTKSGEKRYFFAASEDICEMRGNELSIFFEFRAKTNKDKASTRPNQDKINEENLQAIQEALKNEGVSFKDDANDKLAKNLNKYTKKNTSDYFIHKDLGGFLRRELDAYIKNEIINLDDAFNSNTNDIGRRMLDCRVLRNTCHKIIDFLSQIEDFQKRLWMKKKFVMQTDYCITLDYIDEKHYNKILGNKKQLESWAELYGFDLKTESKRLKNKLDGYTISNQAEVLKHNLTLMIDTKFFDSDFKLQLLEDIDVSDTKIDGVLINSENFHALNLLLAKYRGKIDCCYNDPPYNTDASAILYKNNYRHSSWITLLDSSLTECVKLLSNNAIHCIAIDDFELHKLSLILPRIFCNGRHLGTIVVRSNPHGRGVAAGFSVNHEYAIFYGLSPNAAPGRLPRSEEELGRYGETDERGKFAWTKFQKVGVDSTQEARPHAYYPLFVHGDRIRIPAMSWYNLDMEWHIREKAKPTETVIYPIDDDGNERVWSWGLERTREFKKDLRVMKNGSDITIQFKYRPNPEGKLPFTWWAEPKYSATDSGTRTLKDMFGKRNTFSYPKSVFLVMDCLRAANCHKAATVLDCFAGSGTTAHAILKMNKGDDGMRKYVLIEAGDYFDYVLKPRIQKAVYSDKWAKGDAENNDGTGRHIIKYQRLEQYEDSLENINLSQKQLDYFPDCFAKYMLDFETRESRTLLSVDGMADPFDYKLNVLTSSGQKHDSIDLVETYNYLLGLHFAGLKVLRNDGRKYVIVRGEYGGRGVAIVWRSTIDLDLEADRDFIRKNVPTQDYDEMHVNGNSLVENAVMIESKFKRLMGGD